MKQISKPNVKTTQTPQGASADKPRTISVRLTVITEEEREKYRIPVYDYLLP